MQMRIEYNKLDKEHRVYKNETSRSPAGIIENLGEYMFTPRYDQCFTAESLMEIVEYMKKLTKKG